MAQIIQFNPYLKQFRDMWVEDRWQFSNLLVRLNIKQENLGLDTSEEMILETIEKVIEENNNNWLDGYSYSSGRLTRT